MICGRAVAQNQGMTREEFDGLVQKLEKLSQTNPGGYRARIIGLLALAYVYLGFILFGSLALCLLMLGMMVYAPSVLTLKLGIVGLVAFGGIFLAVARGLWVRLEPPKGEVVTREQAPKLFALLDELRGALDCKPFHQVLILGDVNAGVVQVPRLGMFGWHRNYLVIGLPLMQILGPDELKAVLAHEFAHSSRGHGRFGNWIYRVRRTWDQIIQQMARQRSRLGFALFKFVNWYWPIFNGHAFVLSRANEYEADACSARLASADAAARALLRVRVDGALLGERFWPGVFERAKDEKDPPADIALAADRAVKAGPAAGDSARWLRQAFLVETNNVDTHPCLRDRLRAMGRLPAGVESGRFPEALPDAPKTTAAEYFLGDFGVALARKMSEDWRKAVAPKWSARHEHAQKLAGELAALNASEAAPVSAAKLWEKAHKVVELDGDSAALPMLEQLIALEPQHPGANFVLGRYYLGLDDARGVKFMETAMASDPTLAQSGCNLLYGHFNRTGQHDKLRPLEHRFDDFQGAQLRAAQERGRLSAADRFLPHELTPAQAGELRRILAGEPDIGWAVVARKQVEHLPASPCYAIGLKIRAPWWQVRGRGANQQLVQRVLRQAKLPGHCLVFVAEKNFRGVGEKIRAVPGAMIYRKEKR